MAAAAMDTERPWSIEEMTSNVDSVQECVLAEILAHNAGTEYLRKCGLPTDRAAFRANVPVVSYDDLKPYIQRIANGDRSPILSSQPVTDLITSSGTSSGECKLVPNSNDAGGRLRRLQSLLMPMMNSHFPGLDKGKALYFLFVRPETKTPGGLTVWPLLTRAYTLSRPGRGRTAPGASGFHNEAPQFRFVRRSNVVLSVEFDKTDEDELQRAVERASELLRPHGASVAEYTSRMCTERIPGHYVIYRELLPLSAGAGAGAGAAVDRETLDGCCVELEQALSTVYRRSRVVDGSIGPLEIRVVRPGTFEELMDYAISRGASINQYKAPRCVTLPPVIQLLESRVVSVHRSAALPTWNPTRPYE